MGFWGRSRFETEGKHILVTGGSQGFGLALAKQLVLRGGHVTIAARTESKLKVAVEELLKLKAHDDQVIQYRSVDLTNYEDVKTMIDCLEVCPDHLAHCAGSSYPGFFVDLHPVVFENQMRQNYLASVYITHALIKRMKDISVPYSRRIMLTSSILSALPLVGYNAYSPTKAAVRALADGLRQECILYGIEVSIFLPATILSPGYEEENRLKPSLVLEMEKSDKAQTCETVAYYCMKGLDNGDFAITNNFVGDIMKNHSRTSSPHDNPILEFLYCMLTFFVWPFVRTQLDQDVYKYALEHRLRTVAPSRSNSFVTLLLSSIQFCIFYYLIPSLVANPYVTLLKTFPLWLLLQTIQTYFQRPRGHFTLATIIRSIGAMSLGSVVIAFTLLAFGAPLVNNFQLSFLCAATLSVLIIYPLSFFFQADYMCWGQFLAFKQFKTLGSLQYRAWGPILGAWAGAIPIPLDWDRPWQAWPITVVVGSFIGHLIATILGELLQ
ncbi:pig-F/3-ketosphinganine reductase fusion protein [Schizosaccharomyces osmophilus]|uniref:3-dehydrosphinganine reductase n=1 Tax=Schizosaccharomyces osmophilus TaxID=2545709 RepID=A0AAF0AX59_9SCHI|nr:pig-F/3-ketosphinganine reductase fusion protein [Schizosaccharomyces osmophilus]WBW73549.1 pig-F/3-ketosphinganine reductase fusion protein [Schizosaccharomyces osmophilus]